MSESSILELWTCCGTYCRSYEPHQVVKPFLSLRIRHVLGELALNLLVPSRNLPRRVQLGYRCPEMVLQLVEDPIFCFLEGSIRTSQYGRSTCLHAPEPVQESSLQVLRYAPVSQSSGPSRGIFPMISRPSDECSRIRILC